MNHISYNMHFRTLMIIFGDNCLRFGVKLDIGKLDNGNHKEMTLKSILNSMNIHTVLYIF